ncbi:hypothetical protein ACFLU6_02880 [Acidobacteriota bacterium]
MRRSCCAVLVLLTAGLAAFACAQETAKAPPSAKIWIDRKADFEERLKTAEVVKVKDIGQGVTNPKKVTLQYDGRTFHAVFKPIEPGRQRGFWESYEAEVAAYELDKLLGLDMVPPTIERKVDKHFGSLQLWVYDCKLYKEVQDKTPRTMAWSNQISRMKIFDNLVDNRDRNAGNFMVDEAWKIVLIDHSRAFMTRKGLAKKPAQQPVRYDRRLMEKLEALDKETLDSRMKGLLMQGQINSLLKRRDALLEHRDKLIEKRGESDVLF